MLKNLQKSVDIEKYALPVSRAEFPQPFISELEFNAPARGMWNIVHTGMLIPESHQIYVCAQGCLRGVILTAAEMNAMDRMSFVAVRENELFAQKVLDVQNTGRVLLGRWNIPFGDYS